LLSERMQWKGMEQMPGRIEGGKSEKGRYGSIGSDVYLAPKHRAPS